MIQARSRPIVRIRPRWRLVGLIRDWTPECGSATSIRTNELSTGSPTSVPAKALHLGEPRRMKMDTPGLAQPISLPIGWFDICADKAVSYSSLASLLGRHPTDACLPPDQARQEDLLVRLAAVLQPPLEYLCASQGVLDWQDPLLPFQKEGIKALITRRELLLADDMGLGKTIQAIAALRILFFRHEITSALIVCPASLLLQWNSELNRWAPELRVAVVAGTPSERGSLWRIPAHVRLISYETLRADVLDLQDSPVLRSEWDVVVLDEASRIKNPETAVAIACKRLPRKRRWALTGTPLENRTDDLLSIFDFLLGDPGVRPHSFASTVELRAQLRQIQLRRKKSDVLQDLPAKQVNELLVELPAKQREAYDRAEQEGIIRLTEAGDSATVTHVLELISRLKQLCNYEPVSGESAKLADIVERIRTLVEEGHRALIFSQFTDDRYGVGRVVKQLAEFNPLCFTGALSAAQRNSVIERFLSNPQNKVLVLSLRAGGVGLNLQAASYVFHLDRWWNPAIEEQADSRAHRMGQVYPVTVFRYICANTIEERIDQKLREKRRLFQEIVDDVSLDLSIVLNEEELFGLFGLTPTKPEAVSHRPDSGSSPDFQGMTGQEFEEWVANQLRSFGFDVEITPIARDGGVDLVARYTDALQIETKLLIQCKNQREPVGVAVVRELRGVLPDRTPGTTAVVISPSGFTADAEAFASAHGVQLWGPEKLKQLSRQT